MLVLTRRKGERSIITLNGERAVVTVLEIRGDKIRLGFEAARQVRIDREEIADRKAVK